MTEEWSDILLMDCDNHWKKTLDGTWPHYSSRFVNWGLLLSEQYQRVYVTEM